MRWQVKSATQNLISRLPDPCSYAVYYWVQRHFGSLRRVDPREALKAAVDLWSRIERAGRDGAGGVFLEIGTGRRINMPLAYWLLGASKVFTVDVNPYLRDELVREDLSYMQTHLDEITRLFGGRLRRDRMLKLIAASHSARSVRDLLDTCAIEYKVVVPGRPLPLPAQSVDFHTSYDVFEHVPMSDLVPILEDGQRLLRDDGLLVHRIDLSDHFAHADRSLSAIDFLRYDDRTFSRIAGNRYMYMNRLRMDDFVRLLEDTGHSLLVVEPDEDSFLLKRLKAGEIPLAARFRDKPPEVLATTGIWVVARAEARIKAAAGAGDAGAERECAHVRGSERSRQARTAWRATSDAN